MNRIRLLLVGALLLAAAGSVPAIDAPTNLVIRRVGSNVNLYWSEVTGATDYYIYVDYDPDVDLSFPSYTTQDTFYTDALAGLDIDVFYAVTAILPAGNLTGTIRDTSGVAFQGVLVEVTNTSTNEQYRAYTLSDGSYTLSELPVGTYSVCLYRYLRPVQFPANQSITDGNNTILDWEFADFDWTPVIGALAGTTNWVNTQVYLLQGPISVPGGSVLNIEEGTTIIGLQDTAGFGVALLEIEQDADLNSLGSKYKPVVFTSSRPEGSRTDGDWGGVIISGRAQNNRGLVAVGEGNTGPYGSADTLGNNDNSGIIRYTRLEFPGYRFTGTNELNGFCMQSVGRGTTLEYIMVSRGQDDTFEFFGGTAGGHHWVCADGGDDHIDWTEGWQGSVQFAAIHTYAEFSDNGIEADGLEQNNDAVPHSHAFLSNITFFGKRGNSQGGGEGNELIQLRRGTKATINNCIVQNGRGMGLDLDDASTSHRAALGVDMVDPDSMSINYCIFWDNGTVASEAIDPSTGAGIGDGHFAVEDAETLATNFPVNTTHIAAPTGWTQNIAGFRAPRGWVGNNATNRVVNPMLINPLPNGPGPSPLNLVGYDLRPAAGSPALSGAAPSLPAGQTVVPYVGAFSGPTDDWAVGWTNYVVN